MGSLQTSDQEAAAVAVAPRVALADIEAAIAQRWDFNAGEVIRRHVEEFHRNRAAPALDILSVCVLVMKNGFTILGKSAPASPENFNAELGRKLAYEDCIRQIWPLMGYALRDKLAAQ